MKETKINNIRIYYNDGREVIIDSYELEKIEQLSETLRWVERAKQIYEQLEPLFKK